MVNPKTVNAWGAGSAKMDDQEGSEFSLWSGSVWGKNIKVIPQKLLIQEWFSDTENEKWTEPSIATFTLIKIDGENTQIDFLQTNVPDADFKDIEIGWKTYYLDPLKDYLEK